jgi:hypothetical protein
MEDTAPIDKVASNNGYDLDRVLVCWDHDTPLDDEWRRPRFDPFRRLRATKPHLTFLGYGEEWSSGEDS